MSSKKTRKKGTAETNVEYLIDLAKEHGGFRELWALHPFREGKLFSNYAPGELPKYGWARRPDGATLKYVEGVIGAPLTLESLQTFLQTQCNAQNLDGWTWKHILWALYHHQEGKPNEYSKPLGLKEWAIIFDVGRNKMREMINGSEYRFEKVGENGRKWKLLKSDIPAEYLEKYRAHAGR